MLDHLSIPKEFTDFLLVTIFSLIIGLSQRRMQIEKGDKIVFGTDRTFTFIGILGYLFYISDKSITLYLAGAVMLTIFLAVFYLMKIKDTGKYGLTTILTALLTYALPPVLITQPFWLYLLAIVTILIFTEIKATLFQFSSRFDKDEFLVLGKFLVIAGVILPIVPDEPIVSYLSVTPYKIWLAVVVISSISYLSYLIRKFVFKNSGILISGILGGLYSSTATTFVLSRKSREAGQDRQLYSAAIIFATSMMYLRILILVFIFNKQLYNILLIPFLILFLLSAATGGFITLRNRRFLVTDKVSIESDNNPLEFKVAIIFTVLYVAFTFITHFTVQQYGKGGLNVLSYIVGVTDIDPFLLNLFQGKYAVSLDAVAQATLQAIISNNIIKLLYALGLSAKNMRKHLLAGFGIIIIINFILLFFI